MPERTTKRTVTFKNAFTLGDFDEILSPGSYLIETDEVRLEGLSFQAYRRVRTVIHLPVKPGHPGVSRTLTIIPDDLEAALKHDAAAETVPPEKPSSHIQPQILDGEHERETDRKAVDRAADEGMTAPGDGRP